MTTFFASCSLKWIQSTSRSVDEIPVEGDFEVDSFVIKAVRLVTLAVVTRSRVIIKKASVLAEETCYRPS